MNPHNNPIIPIFANEETESLGVLFAWNHMIMCGGGSLQTHEETHTLKLEAIWA